MKISVALATYNGGKYLQEQLDSLAAQTLLPAELVVGDDGSTDDTLQILDSFAKIAPFPVRIQKNPARLGYRANFMAAVQRCEGDLISFCDQDDYWKPENLERVASAFSDPDVLLAFHNARIVDADRRALWPFYVEPPVPPLSRKLTIWPWMFAYGFSQTFRASLLPATDFWVLLEDHLEAGEKMGHDVVFFLLASGLGSIRYLHEELTEYRQHGANLFGFGKRAKPNLLQRLRFWLEYRADMYRGLSRVAPLNAIFFEKLSASTKFTNEFRIRAKDAALSWTQLQMLYAYRTKACSGRLVGRIAAFRYLVQAGAYGESTLWTFGSKAMIKDFIVGVLFAPVVKKLGIESAKSDRSCRRGRRS